MLRLLFYCHNVTGLGHIIRSLQIATAAVALEACECTVVTGCAHLDKLAIDRRLHVEPLPPARLSQDLRFVAADPALSDADIMEVRSARLLDITRRIQPSAMLVDHLPLGLAGEMLPTLTAAISERWPTRFIWGIPYVEGGFGSTKPPGNPAIKRALGHFSSAIAYVDGAENQVLAQYPSWMVPRKHAYVGFVADYPLPSLDPVPGLAVVVCGGGVHAQSLCRLVLAARRKSPSKNIRLRFVIGPLADAADMIDLLKSEEHVEVWRAGTVQEAIQDAAIVIGRAGYNSSLMLMRASLPVIFVPTAFSVPTARDQARRAAQFAALPGVWNISEADPHAEAQLAQAITDALATGPVDRAITWHFDGAQEAARWVIAEAKGVEHEDQSAQEGAR